MNIDIYCDESRLELLEGNKNGYMIIGSLWLARKEREKLKNEINKMIKTLILVINETFARSALV